jgi:hypothetical protein
MMTKAPPVLLFVPGVFPIDGNNATRIAEVIASSQSVQRAGTYSIKLGSGEPGRASMASIIDPGGEVALKVIDVDYRMRLAETPYGKDSRGWTLLRSGRFALLGILRLLSARRRSKSGRHRWFLLMGFALELLLIGAFACLAIAALAALGVIEIANVNARMEAVDRWMKANQLMLGAGLTSTAGALYWLRARIIQGGQRVREIVRYLERDREAASVALELDREIDRLLEESPPPSAIHILAYSFGSIVALDALFPRDLGLRTGPDRIAAAITSLVTVGSPVDFVRQFYPHYLEGRMARAAGLPWTNLFLPEDILGSNFLDDDDHSGYESPPTGDRASGLASVHPTRSVAVGRERLGLKSLLSLEGVRIHGEYWDQAHRAHLLGPVIDSWLPPPASPPPASPQPGAQLALGAALTVADVSHRAAAPPGDGAAASPAEGAAAPRAEGAASPPGDGTGSPPTG